jgi:type I restriction enzyme S subunit
LRQVPLKRVARVIAGQSPSSEDVEELDGDLPFLQGNAEFGPLHPRPRYQCASPPKCALTGDILLSVRAPVGALNVADRVYGIGRGLAAIRSVGVDYRFLWWALHAATGELRAVATGSTFEAVTADDIGAVRIWCHQRLRQQEIADFLDAETARIDTLIEKKQRMIALTNEWLRASLDAAFPRTGQRVRLGRFVSLLAQGTSPQAEGREAARSEWGVLKLSAVRLGRYRPTENKALPPEYEANAALVPQRGDLLVTRSNTPEYVGDACAVSEDVPYRMLSDLIYLLRLDRRLDPQYAAFALLSSDARRQIESAARGSSQSMVKLRGEDVKAVEIPYFSLEEQGMIVQEIESRRSAADRLVDRLEHQIALLREHRQALITAAVTGELDLAKAAA